MQLLPLLKGRRNHSNVEPSDLGTRYIVLVIQVCESLSSVCAFQGTGLSHLLSYLKCLIF